MTIRGPKSLVASGSEPKSHMLSCLKQKSVVFFLNPGYDKSHTVGLKPKSLVFLSAVARALPRKVSYLLRESHKYPLVDLEDPLRVRGKGKIGGEAALKAKGTRLFAIFGFWLVAWERGRGEGPPSNSKHDPQKHCKAS